MTVSAVLIIVMAVLFAAGVFSILDRSLTRILIGFLLLGNAINLLFLIAMGAPGAAPFFSAQNGEAGVSDPLPQALMLTAIVITFAVSAFLLALIYRSWRLDRADVLRDDEEDRAVRERAGAAEREAEFEKSVEPHDDAGVGTDTDFIDTHTTPVRISSVRSGAKTHRSRGGNE